MLSRSAPSRRKALYEEIEIFEKDLEDRARAAGMLAIAECITLTMTISRNPKPRTNVKGRKKYRRCKPINKELTPEDWQRMVNAKTIKKGLQITLIRFFRDRGNKPATGKEIDSLLGYRVQRKIRFIPNHTSGLNDALRDAKLPYRMLVTTRSWNRKKTMIPYRFFIVE